MYTSLAVALTCAETIPGLGVLGNSVPELLMALHSSLHGFSNEMLVGHSPLMVPKNTSQCSALS